MDQPSELRDVPPAGDTYTLPRRSLVRAMLRGASLKCPSCGKAPLYAKYLKVVHTCPSCGEELHHQRADDAPAYFTMLIVGHIVVFGVLTVETLYAPPTWVHTLIWLPLTVILSLWLLPRVKGILIGLQWALRMHGFGSPAPGIDKPDPEPTPLS